MMFKKLAILLVPFLFAPISLGLSHSAAHAQTTAAWTPWSIGRLFTGNQCYFDGDDYSYWRAFIQYRESDNAARVVRIQFGGDETIRVVQAWTSREVDGGRQVVPNSRLTITAGGRTDWITTPAYYGGAYVSNLFTPRYVNVQFSHTNGDICTAEMEIPR
jgi:hypothetical protein